MASRGEVLIFFLLAPLLGCGGAFSGPWDFEREGNELHVTGDGKDVRYRALGPWEAEFLLINAQDEADIESAGLGKNIISVLPRDAALEIESRWPNFRRCGTEDAYRAKPYIEQVMLRIWLVPENDNSEAAVGSIEAVRKEREATSGYSQWILLRGEGLEFVSQRRSGQEVNWRRDDQTAYLLLREMEWLDRS